MTFNEMIILMELDWGKTARAAALTAGLGLPAALSTSIHSNPNFRNTSLSSISEPKFLEPSKPSLTDKIGNVNPLITTTPTYSTSKNEIPTNSKIDINKIISIESHGRSNAVSNKGARGIMQIMPDTWNELVKKMGKSYATADINDPIKNKEVGTYYLNIEIPKLLKSANIPVNTKTILAAYNWGVGNLKNSWQKHGENWDKFAPLETKNYIYKYFQ